MKNIFTKHLQEVDESYLQHMAFALKLSLIMFLGAVVCFFHALFPFIFQRTGSKIVTKMAVSLIKGNRSDLSNRE